MPLEGDLDVRVGASVEFVFTVANTDPAPRELEFASGRAADFVVLADDEPIWRWSDGRLFTQALERVTLAPGESVVHDGAWSDPEPGSYVVVASLAATNADVEARAEFAV